MCPFKKVILTATHGTWIIASHSEGIYNSVEHIRAVILMSSLDILDMLFNAIYTILYVIDL